MTTTAITLTATTAPIPTSMASGCSRTDHSQTARGYDGAISSSTWCTIFMYVILLLTAYLLYH